jgi:hypothetical protein
MRVPKPPAEVAFVGKLPAWPWADLKSAGGWGEVRSFTCKSVLFGVQAPRLATGVTVFKVEIHCI